MPTRKKTNGEVTPRETDDLTQPRTARVLLELRKDAPVTSATVATITMAPCNDGSCTRDSSIALLRALEAWECRAALCRRDRGTAIIDTSGIQS